MAASARPHAAGKPSRVEAERDTTSTFQPWPRNMAMIPTPMVPPPTTRAWRSLCGIFHPPNSTDAPAAGQYHGSHIARGKFMSATFKDIGVSSEGHVGVVEIQRP